MNRLVRTILEFARPPRRAGSVRPRRLRLRALAGLVGGFCAACSPAREVKPLAPRPDPIAMPLKKPVPRVPQADQSSMPGPGTGPTVPPQDGGLPVTPESEKNLPTAAESATEAPQPRK